MLGFDPGRKPVAYDIAKIEDRWVCNAVDRTGSFGAATDNSSIEQNAQVFGYIGLIAFDRLYYLPHGSRAAPEYL
jgi:hypothetical protein